MADHEEVADSIAEHRMAIDELDERIVALLNERAEHSFAVRALKNRAGLDTYDAGREDAICARLAHLGDGPLEPCDLEEIYHSVLHVMKASAAGGPGAWDDALELQARA